ncbi:MAG: type I-E CRISPR-associated protein Cse2/CasB [Armatimonadota bacterium]
MTTEAQVPTAIEAFVSRLEELCERDGPARAELARLKRCAGRPLEECPEIFPLFYRLLPAQIRGNEWAEADYFTVATLFPLAPKRFTGDFGVTMRRMKTSAGEQDDGVTRRMTVLLDCARSDLSFRLRQLVQRAKALEAPIDWRVLLHDLQRWDHPRRIAQKNWARNYFGSETVKAEIQSEEENTTC